MSIQTANLKSTITTLPLSQILRPIVPVLDHSKVDSMVCTLQRDPSEATSDPTELPPVDVLHYKSPTKGDMYFAFGGCHRMKAYEQAGVEEVRVKVMKVHKGLLKMYLGASTDAILGEEQ